MDTFVVVSLKTKRKINFFVSRIPLRTWVNIEWLNNEFQQLVEKGISSIPGALLKFPLDIVVELFPPWEKKFPDTRATSDFNHPHNSLPSNLPLVECAIIILTVGCDYWTSLACFIVVKNNIARWNVTGKFSIHSLLNNKRKYFHHRISCATLESIELSKQK